MVRGWFVGALALLTLPSMSHAGSYRECKGSACISIHGNGSMRKDSEPSKVPGIIRVRTQDTTGEVSLRVSAKSSAIVCVGLRAPDKRIRNVVDQAEVQPVVTTDIWRGQQCFGAVHRRPVESQLPIGLCEPNLDEPVLVVGVFQYQRSRERPSKHEVLDSRPQFIWSFSVKALLSWWRKLKRVRK